MRRPSSIVLFFCVLPAVAGAQTLAQRVAALGDGSLRLQFAARAGVCGNGGHSITIVDDDDRGEWESDCTPRPVRVSLRVHAGRVQEANTYVGGRWRNPGAATDLGALPARQAASDLLALAEGSRAGADELITAATLADSAVVWPDPPPDGAPDRPPARDPAEGGLLAGAGGGRGGRRAGLDSLAGDGGGELEVRKQAVFALSQRPADEGVPALIRIARTSPHAELRKTALFWLGQSEDPRAIELFEEILR